MTTRLPRTIPVVPVVANLARARARDRLAPEPMARLQSRLLTRLVRHAHANVPYYRDLLDPGAVAGFAGPADLTGLPVLDRGEIPAIGVGALLADGFTADNTRAASTSGTSGTPTVIHYSEGDLGYLRATYLWDLLATGLRPTDRIGYFRVGGFRRHRLERLGLARNVHVNTSLPLDDQVDSFLAGRPTFLCGFPNAIAAVVAELRRRRVPTPWVRGVVFAGEKVTPASRAEVLDHLGAVGHEVYSCVEAYTIARTCSHGRLHLRSGDVVVEVEHDDGTVSVADGEGEILVTRLHAEAMPLLRYRLGDRVSIVPDDCPCETFRTPVLREIRGRVVDRVRTRDGRIRNGEFFISLVHHVDGVRQFQLVQREPGEVEVLVVPADGARDLAARVTVAAEDASCDFDVRVRLVERIDPEVNGKIRVVKSLVG